MAYGYAAEKLAKCGKGDNILVEGQLDYFEPKEEGGEKSAYVKAEKIVTSPKPKSGQTSDDIPFG